MTEIALGAFVLITLGSAVTVIIGTVALLGIAAVEWWKYRRGE